MPFISPSFRSLGAMLMVLGCAFCLAACQHALLRPEVPLKLQVPDDQQLLMRATVKGIQPYVCQSQPANAFRWVALEPAAELYEPSGHLVATERGLQWRTPEGATLVGEVLESIPPESDRKAPSLLLRISAPYSQGALSNVQYIQRLNATAPAFPVAICDAAHVGVVLNSSSLLSG